MFQPSLPFPMKLDSHQHFWSYDAAQYPWIAPRLASAARWLPPDLAPLLAAAGLDGSIAVQARQTIDESHWLLGTGRASLGRQRRGRLGGPPLAGRRARPRRIAPHPKFCGVRTWCRMNRTTISCSAAAFQRGIGKLHAFQLTYDILIFPRQLPAAIELVHRFPGQPFVLDHIAKPSIMDGTLSPWREQIRELAKAPNVLCKVGGMVTEADLIAWKPADFRPYLDVVFEGSARTG